MKRREFLVGTAVAAATAFGVSGEGAQTPPQGERQGGPPSAAWRPGTGGREGARPRSGGGATGEARAHLADDAQLQSLHS